MLEHEYRAQMNAAKFDPGFSERVLRELSLAQSGKENAMKKRKKTWKIALIAAVLAIALTVSAGAIILNNLEQARNDLRITAPIPEWTEYEDAANADGTVRLISSLCSGDVLDAYFEVGPIDAGTGRNLQENQGSGGCGWEAWELSTGKSTVAFHLTQLSYDAASETALLRLEFQGAALEDMDELTLTLERRDGEAEQAVSYPAVTVPLVKAETLRTNMDCAFSGEGVTGTVTGAAIRAGSVEFSIVIDGVAPGEETLDERHSRTVAYRAAAVSALDGAVLNLTDGSSVRVADLPSLYASDAGWVVAGFELQPVEEGSFALQRITAQALDLSKIVSVTLDGTTYPLA